MCEKEYESLRTELNENKKYVFERPLVIFTAACIFFDYAAKSEYVLIFPCLVILLLLFNLHFTANRLNSNARIIAYIRCSIESKHPENYRWETFLNNYRVKGEHKGLNYYPIIYYFHIALVSVLCFLEFFLFAFQDWEKIDSFYSKQILVIILTIILLIVSALYFFKIFKITLPREVRNFFHRETAQVEKVLKEMEKNNLNTA